MSDDSLKGDALERATGALSRRLRGVDASLDDRVMAEVRQTRRPRVLSFRPALFIPLAAAALFAAWFAGTRMGVRAAGQALPIMANAPRSDTVYVRFELAAPDARAVHLAGDFTEWRADAIPLMRGSGGTWSVTLPMVVGQHAYQFVVDNERWIPDPGAGSVEDGFGGRNSVIVVGPKGVVRS